MRFSPAFGSARALVAVLLLATAGCGASSTIVALTHTQGAQAVLRSGIVRSLMHRRFAPHDSSSGKIQHVVFIIQENRSFNNLFMNFKGATTAKYGYNAGNQKVKLSPQPLAESWDLDHSVSGFLQDYANGKLNGWAHSAFSYTRKSDIVPYWTMAKKYVLADNMFQSNIDDSFISHQYAISAFANHAANYPSGAWGCSQSGSGDVINTLTQNRTIGPNIAVCFNQQTLGDELDAAGVGWRFYSAPTNDSGYIWSAYQAISHIYYGPDWTNDVVTPSSQIITDVQNGNLQPVSWVTPSWRNSDHPGTGSNTGPSWVTSVVNAIGESQYWDSTAIFIIWDDWGGWFDPVPPVYEDYDGLGFRIPLIVVSPYAKPGYVSHTQYETASVLRFVEDTFGLGQLAASDARANDPAGDCFDFNQKPRRYSTIDARFPAAYFLHQKPDYKSRTED